MKTDGLIYSPIIHFKEGHLGSINQEELFAFPLCSLYIPHDLEVSTINKSEYTPTRKAEYVFKQMDFDVDRRVDIFITPKGLSVHKIVSSSLGFLYAMADVELFNTREGIFTMLNEMNEPRESFIEIIQDFNGHDLIIRIVDKQANSNTFSNLEGSFSLLLHDPIDAYQRISNRFILEIPENANFLSEKSLLNKAEILKNKYEKELRRK